MEVINNCGVSFSVWEKRNVDGKISGLYDWISMVGNEKKKVRSNLFKEFLNILRIEYCDIIS